jgi:hypothetical protein
VRFKTLVAIILITIGVVGLAFDGTHTSPAIAADDPLDGTVNSMPVPVSSASDWTVICGYGCGDHGTTSATHVSLYAMDIARGTATAGTTVVSPIKGYVVWIADGYVSCDSVRDKGVIIDEIRPDGKLSGHRITLLHMSVSAGKGALVQEGTKVGTVYDHGSCSHVHINHTNVSACAGTAGTSCGFNRSESPLVMKLAGRTYADCPSVQCWGHRTWSPCTTATQEADANAHCQHHLRNNSLYSSPNKTGSRTQVEIQDRNLSGDAVADNSADSVIVNVGCRMRVYDLVNFGSPYKDVTGSTGKYVNLSTISFANKTSSVKVLCP